MNEHRKIVTLGRCLREAEGLDGRVFGDSYVGFFVVKDERGQEIPIAEGGIPKVLTVLYWDFTSHDPREREFNVEEHENDRALPSEILLEALRGTAYPLRTAYIQSVVNGETVASYREHDSRTAIPQVKPQVAR